MLQGAGIEGRDKEKKKTDGRKKEQEIKKTRLSNKYACETGKAGHENEGKIKDGREEEIITVRTDKVNLMATKATKKKRVYDM